MSTGIYDRNKAKFNSGCFRKDCAPWNIGIPRSIAARRKMSESHKGLPAWNKGISCPEEVKQKIRVAQIDMKI